MRNAFLSNKLKQTETRLLIIDDNQIRYNQIVTLLTAKGHQVHAHLLDDVKNFEKQLNTPWDIVLFGRAYDFKVEQALTLIRASKQYQLPLLLLNPEDYTPSQYLTYINKGVYDLFNLDYPDRFYIGLVRTLSYSRSLQTQNYLNAELAQFETRLQNYSNENRIAIARIHEGIHVQANAEYLALFGLKNEDEIIGLPLLDILQPQDIQTFKQNFKRISQYNFEQARFDIHSQNPHVKSPLLKVEFLPGNSADIVQLTIETENTAPIEKAKPTPKEPQNTYTYEQLNRKMLSEPANKNTLIVFLLNHPHTHLAHLNQDDMLNYLQGIQQFLQVQTQANILKLSPSIYVYLLQAASTEFVESKLRSLQALLKPQLIQVGDQNYTAQFEIGAQSIDSAIENQAQFEYLVIQALAHPLKLQMAAETVDFSTLEQKESPLEEKPTVQMPNEAPILGAHLDRESQLLTQIATQIDDNSIHLKYQQLYDKQDTELYIYEVTSGTIHNNQWLGLNDLNELKKDQELSIQLDRWILVEACKQLHNFITRYPNTKLIINLNIDILLHAEQQLFGLLDKLLAIVRSQHAALVLQFPTLELFKHLDHVKESLATLTTQGIAISVRQFGLNRESATLLQQLKLDFCQLDPNLTQNLSNEAELQQLQAALEQFKSINPVEMVLTQLNDMNSFANAWNVDIRYLQGDYFQKRVDSLVDVQGH
ncbi:EAL domain-containing protein [Acinetobacter sp. MD2]|uniref:EAL domain-containing protein n=1 Tax=Acinetobacter sp. MD2 TaxID=2600066 RepID=UPI002D1EAC4F|nr:EAL domain-containing protein [Acinetobacter sp. MD2]MEB3767805.1 EAL domain-containing protein [Acinetobacter sp. MD2]